MKKSPAEGLFFYRYVLLHSRKHRVLQTRRSGPEQTIPIVSPRVTSYNYSLRSILASALGPASRFVAFGELLTTLRLRNDNNKKPLLEQRFFISFDVRSLIR